MKPLGILATAILLLLSSGVVSTLEAQWSSDLPGVPRAGIVRLGPAQGRFELDVSWLRPESTVGDSTIWRGRMGAGWSWRVASAFELGFDLTLAEAQHVRASDTTSVPAQKPATSIMVTGGYGLRLGLKFRPVSYVDLEGNGVEAAIGIGYQPRLDPLIYHETRGDSSVTGGVLGSTETDTPRVHSSLLLLATVGYRSPRVTADAALVAENPDRSERSLLHVYSGLSPRVGVRYRLTHGFSVGASFWGTGSPPWRDRLSTGQAEGSDDRLGLMLSFGSAPEKSTDIMISSPTGSFGRSITLYVTAR